MEFLEKRNSVTHQLYAQNLVITAVTCFIGGIAFTFLIALIYYKVSLRKNLKEGTIEKAEEANGTMENPPDINEWRNHIHMDNSMVFDQEVMTLDPRTYDPVDQLDISDKNNQFWYSNCCNKEHRGIRQNRIRWDNRTNTQVKRDEEIQRRLRMITEHDLKMFATQRGILEFTDKLSHSRTSPHPRKEAVRRVEALVNSQEKGPCYKAEGGGCSKINEALYANSCHRLCRPSEPNLKKCRVHTKIEDCHFLSDFPCQHREIDRDLHIGDKYDMSKDIHIRRKTRNVTFNLERLRNSSQQSDDERNSRDEEREGNQNSKVQLRRLKGKINLNQKSKVHPKRSEQGHLCRTRSKNSKGKRVTRKDRGKTKEGHQKRKKSAKLKGLAEDGDEQKEDNGQMGEKTKKTYIIGPESIATDQCAKETAQSVDNTNTADQLPSEYQHLQNRSIQHYSVPPNLSISVDNSLSLQGGSFLHNTMTTGSSSLFDGLTYPIPPSTLINESNMTPNDAPGTFNGQEYVLASAGVLPPNILKLSSVYTSPLLATGQNDFLISTVDSSAFQQSLPPPTGSSPIIKLQSDSTIMPGPQPGSGVDQLPPPEHRKFSVETENRDEPDLTESLPLRDSGVRIQTGEGPVVSDSLNTMSNHIVLNADTDDEAAKVLQQQEYLSEEGSSKLKRKLRLVLPEKMSSRPLTALEKKIR